MLTAALPHMEATAATTVYSIGGPTASPSSVAAGGSEGLGATFTSSSTVTGMIVDLEVFDAADNRVFQTYQTGVTLTANVGWQYSATWQIPAGQAAGTYRVRAGLFNAWWSYRYAWTSAGATFAVTSATPTSTASPTPTGTASPSPTSTLSPINTSTPPPAATSTATPAAGGIALGAWIPGDEWDPSVVDGFASMVGVAPRIVMWYQDWVNDSAFHADAMAAYTSRGAMPEVSWLPDAANAPAGFDRSVANGGYDAFLHAWARAAAAWGKPFYLRFAWEMNGTWQPFSPGVNGNTAADFVAMWRHVHDLFVADGATNARWVWCPNMEASGQTPYAAVYPGDAYVDWVGVDGYNWGHYDQWHWWTSLHDLLAQSYADLTALTGKPMVINETSSTEVGGDKAAWITQGLLTDIPASFPRVRAVVWFDENKEVDWRVNSSATSLAAFQQVAKSPLYQGRLS